MALEEAHVYLCNSRGSYLSYAREEAIHWIGFIWTALKRENPAPFRPSGEYVETLDKGFGSTLKCNKIVYTQRILISESSSYADITGLQDACFFLFRHVPGQNTSGCARPWSWIVSTGYTSSLWFSREQILYPNLTLLFWLKLVVLSHHSFWSCIQYL